MAEEHSDHDPPNGGDDEEVAESTIAMGAPTFDPAHMLNVRSPISEPPPPLVVKEKTPLSSPHTAPQDFKVAPVVAPAGVPRLGRQKQPSSPMLPTPLGGLVPSGPGGGPLPAPAGAPARAAQTPTAPGTAPAPAAAPAPAPAPAPVVRPGAAGGPRLRAQTVIGVAPAPPGAPRPVHVRPATGKTPAFAKSEAAASDQGFGLDASVADAARAAVAPGGRQRAPLQSNPGELDVPKIESEPPKLGEEGQTATFAVPREKLPPAAAFGAGPVLFSQDEETQARVSDVHVHDARVVHDDASGDDATISALPHLNIARNINPALAHGFLNDGPPPASAPYSQPHPHHGHPGPIATPAQPAQAWNPPPSQPSPMSQPRATYPSHPGGPPAWNAPPSQPTGPMQFRGPQGQPMPPIQGGHPVQGGQPMAAPGRDPKFSTQVAVVAVVGVVCLLVFIFGIVLFLTSNSAP